MSARRLEDVLKTYNEEVLKIYLEDVLNTCLEDVFKTCIQYVFKTCLQDVFKTCLQCNNFSFSKTSSGRLCKTSWKTKNCYAEGILKTSSRRLQDQQMFTEVVNILMSSKILDSQHALVTWLSKVLISKKFLKNTYGQTKNKVETKKMY